MKALGKLGLMWVWLVFASLVCPGDAVEAESVHVVKRHDTLSALAGRYNVTTRQIALRNHLRNSNLLRLGEKLIIPASRGAEHSYTVQKGDSVASIAKSHGVSVRTIVDRNRLKQPDRIEIGQSLLIPGGARGSHYVLPEALEKQLAKIRAAGRWKNIVIHHSGSPKATPKGMDTYHRSTRHMENGLAYHFVIGNGVRTKDGEIYVAGRWRKQLDGGHLASSALNRCSIGICLVGDFNRTRPTSKQMSSLRNLIAYLMEECRIREDRVMTHGEINPKPTECPGKHFSKNRVMAAVPR